MAETDKVNILVVDDLPEKLLVVGSVLEELGQTVIMAHSGQEALRQVLEREFAVILLDVNMPEMDGYETAALIRRRKKSQHTPIIFITAYADEVHTAQGYAIGAVDYLLSPIVPEVLRSKVSVFVELFRMTQRVKRQADEKVALAREQAARTAAEETVRRLNFLVEASNVLASSLDVEATVRGLLRLVVPRQADLVVVSLIDDTGTHGPTEVAWEEPGQGMHVARVLGTEAIPSPLTALLLRVLQTQKAHYVPQLEAAAKTLAFQLPGETLSLEIRTMLALPLRARGRTLGVMLMGMGPSGRQYETADRVFAEDLAGRAAIALDNACLYRDIQEADRRKNEFLSMLAHELRNPLAPILNGIQILRLKGPTTPDLQKIHSMMERQIHHLVRMVDDLLDISRITQGKIRLRKEDVLVATVVNRALEVSRPLIEARRHQLTVTLPPEELHVKGDPVRLAQVLTNLLNNAAKYTDEGGQVWITVESDSNDVIFRVRDTGVGIPGDMLTSVFDLFTQVNHTMDRSQGGLGIGLTLVHNLVAMHQGKVEAYSLGLNQGSEFTVRLPMVKMENNAERKSTAKSCTPQQLSRRILVVDDNTDAAESLAHLLRAAGHKVHTARDGQDALATAETFSPEIAVLDIGLPGMDGYEVAERLRQRWGQQQLTLVALTGYGQEKDLERSRQAGFDHHLVKPADFGVLSELLTGRASVSVE